MSNNDEKSRSGSWYLKIGNRVMLTAIIAAILPLLLLGGTIALKVRLDLLNQTITSQKNTAATIMHGIGALFNNYRRQIEIVAALPDTQTMLADRQIDIIHDFLEQQKVFFGCTIYDAKGEIKLVAIRSRKDEGKELLGSITDIKSDSPFARTFRFVLQSRQSAVYSGESGQHHDRMLNLMVPIFDFVDSDAVIGIISCSMSISSPDIHEIITGFPIDKQDILLLLDRECNVLSSRGQVPENLKGFNVGNISRKGPDSIEFSLGKTRYLGTIAPVPGSEGLLLIARPSELVLEFLNQLLLDLALMLAIAIVIAVAAGFFLSRPLAEGISVLVAAIKNVSSGVVSHRIEVNGEDELAEASKAFNEMLGTLEKHRMMDDIWNREWNSAKVDSGPEPEKSDDK